MQETKVKEAHHSSASTSTYKQVSMTEGHIEINGISRHLPMMPLNQSRASERKNAVLGKIQRSFDSTSNIKTIKKIINPLGPFSGGWDTLFLLSSVIAVSLDPLFFYLPVVNENKKCLFIDMKLGIAAMVLRSVMDGLCIIFLICQVFILHPNKRGNSPRVGWSIPRGYVLSHRFLVDISAVLPLPQVVVLAILPMMRDTRYMDALNLLTMVVIGQSIPRIFRIYQLLKRDKRTSGTLAEAAWAKAACNLFLYMLWGHALGAVWYFLAIEREITCWKQACANHIGCENGSFDCSGSLGNHTFINDSCPTSESNPKLFDFGIFLDALQAGVLEVVNFPEKFFHCFHWGLQNLSCFGQNLRTSTSVLENCFALFVTVSGLLLFLSLIGNVQIYMQSKTMKQEELRLRNREIEQWKPFKKLPPELRQEIKQYQRYKWQESRGVDVENLLKGFPKDIIKNIKREFCLESLKNVKQFSNLGKLVLNELCYYAKPVLFIERNYIRRTGDPIDEMVFIVQGKVKVYLSSSEHSESENITYLEDGDFCGEELLEEWLNSKYMYQQALHFPISTKTIQAHTKVEAFSLLAADLKNVYNWAATQVQLAYRNHSQRKHHHHHHLLQIKIGAAGGDSIGTMIATPRLVNVDDSDGSSASPLPIAIHEEEGQ